MDSFTYFSALPAELRIAIYRLSLEPRVIEVWYDADADCCRTTAQTPALLHVSREARAEALHKGWYRRAFRTSSRPRDHYIYFSSALDVLYLPRHGLMGYDATARDFTVHVRDTADHVRALAIDHVRTDTIRPWEPYNKLMLLLSFPNVEETMLVVGGRGTSSYDRSVVRRRSQDSIESAQSIASSASSTSLSASFPAASSPPAKGDVELVDPQDDAAAVMEVINNVIESFSREIDAVAASESSVSTTSAAGPSLTKDAAHCLPGRAFPHLPYLIPKAIAYHHQQQRRRQRQKQRYANAICI